LAGLLVLGLVLRVWRVGRYPPLLWDEASLGYNAYSILKTGRDEHGSFLPLIFKSFGDYKPGLYVYLSLPFVALLGLNELAVRLPSVILGSLTPVFLFLLVREVLKKEKLALFSGLALVFLPWQIHFSRGAWESSVMVFFLVLGSYLLAKGVRFGLLSFLLALLTYQGAKMMVPLVLLALFFSGLVSLKRVFSGKGRLASFLIIFLIGWWYFLSFSGTAKNRLKVLSLFSYSRPDEEVATLLVEDGLKEKNLHFYLFHGEWLHFTRGFLTRYFNHFSPKFLAFEGDWNSPRHSAPYFGVIGHVNFILLLIGLGSFLSRKRKKRDYFFLYWLVVAPLPAALTRDIVSGVRSLSMVVPISFFIGFGLNRVLNLNLGGVKRFLIGGLAFLFFLDFIYWFDLYHNHMVKKSPKEWLYGYKEAVGCILENQADFKRVILTDFYGQPYIYYLFYSRYPPEEYQGRIKRLLESKVGDVSRVETLDKISFRPVSWGSDRDTENALIILPHDEFLRGGLDQKPEALSRIRPLGVIDGQSMFYVLENK